MSNAIILDDFRSVPEALAKDLSPWCEEARAAQAAAGKTVTKVMLYITLNPLEAATTSPEILKTGKNTVWAKKPDSIVKYDVDKEGHLVETTHHDSLKDILPKIFAAKSIQFTARAQPASDAVLAEKSLVYQLKATLAQTPA
jgi:hypothetical protein